MRLRPLVAAGFLAAAPLTVAAQAPAPSRADSAAIVLDVARRAQLAGRADLAQYLFELIQDRFPGTPAADSAATARQSLARFTSRQSGAATLAAWGALYGAWLGVAVPVALGAEDPSPIGAGILAGIPTGFFAGRAYGRAAGLSAGQSRAIVFASTFGSFQAVGWRKVLGLGDRRETVCDAFQCFEYQTQSDRAPFAAAIIGGLGGMGTAAVLARSREMSSGTVAAVQWASIWGAWFGAAGAVLANAEGDDATLTWSLAASAASTVVAATQAARWNLTATRPWLVSAAGIAGLVTGLGTDLLFSVDDDQTAVLLPLAGSVAGLVVGIHATRPQGPGGGAREGGSGALLEWGRRGWAVGAPAPVPAGQPALGPLGRVRLRPAMRVPLLSVALP